MKKKYILVLTFLFVLCGQLSYGQTQGGDDNNNNNDKDCTAGQHLDYTVDNGNGSYTDYYTVTNDDCSTYETHSGRTPNTNSTNEDEDDSSNYNSSSGSHNDDGSDPDFNSNYDPCDINSWAYDPYACNGQPEDSNDPCDYFSIAYNECVCDPTSCEETPEVNVDTDPNSDCTQLCTETQRSVTGKTVGEKCPCEQIQKTPCKQLSNLTNSALPANDPSGSNNNLLTANINMLKDKLTNFPIPYTGLFVETGIDVKKNNLDFYSTTVNNLGDNFSASVHTGSPYIGSIHNHPTNGLAIPSIIDLRLLLNTYDRVNPANRDEVFVMVVSKEANGNLAVYNLKINDINKLRVGVNAVWDSPEILKITDEKLKIEAIKDAEAIYYDKAGNDKEKAFLQKNGAFGLDLYKSSNPAMNDWGKLALATDPITNTLKVTKSNCN